MTEFKIGDKIKVSVDSESFSIREREKVNGRVGTIVENTGRYWKVILSEPIKLDTPHDNILLLLDSEMVLVEDESDLKDAVEELSFQIDMASINDLTDALNNHTEALNRYCDLFRG